MSAPLTGFNAVRVKARNACSFSYLTAPMDDVKSYGMSQFSVQLANVEVGPAFLADGEQALASTLISIFYVQAIVSQRFIVLLWLINSFQKIVGEGGTHFGTNQFQIGTPSCRSDSPTHK